MLARTRAAAAQRHLRGVPVARGHAAADVPAVRGLWRARRQVQGIGCVALRARVLGQWSLMQVVSVDALLADAALQLFAVVVEPSLRSLDSHWVACAGRSRGGLGRVPDVLLQL